MPYIAVGDTHGQLAKVKKLVRILERQNLLTGRKLVFLGDYLDRGPDVKGLMSLLLELKKDGHVQILGNHEYVLRQGIALPPGVAKEYWAYYWYCLERNTIGSYGADYIRQIGGNEYGEMAMAFALKLQEAGHLEFLMEMPMWYEGENCIFAHAGIHPRIPWDVQKTTELDPFIEPPQLFEYKFSKTTEHLESGKCVVSGHSYVKTPVVTPSRVLLDTGCGSGGPLSAWVSDTNEIIQAR